MQTQRMAETEQQRSHFPYRRYNPRVEEVVNILQWVLVALILALVFRAFIMEAFRIPTGSMADTLRGDHLHLRCPQCGYLYDQGLDTRGVLPMCPNCDFSIPDGFDVRPFQSHGDRIFVLKCIYQFFEPRRWDVVVFKNPINPLESYIKRLIGKPGEEVEIIDGDIYINGLIARKPPRVQKELWMPVYDSNYHAVAATEKLGRFPRQEEWRWQPPFRNEGSSQWNLDGQGGRVFRLDGVSGEMHTLVYDSGDETDLRARYAYNDSRLYRLRPFCSDLMIEFDAAGPGLRAPQIGAELSKYETRYRGVVTSDGSMYVERHCQGVTEMIGGPFACEPVGARPGHFRFYIVDHMVILEWGGEQVPCELGREPTSAGPILTDAAPTVRILGSGQADLMNVSLYRDIHYIDRNVKRAGHGDPFTLGADEYFVCGDNSPNSEDSRKWMHSGIGNNGTVYTAGAVPRDYLLGKAFFVYWANAYRPAPHLPPIVPNVSQWQIIVGGQEQY